MKHEVKCDVCGKREKVYPMVCLRQGWPKCCTYTMHLSGRGGKHIIKSFKEALQTRRRGSPCLQKGEGDG